VVLQVFVTAASTPERKGAKQVLQQVRQQGEAVFRLQTIWVNGSFDGFPFMDWVITVCRSIVQVVLRPQQTKGFVLLKKCWIVERTFSWLMYCRRLVRDSERLPETSETFIYLPMIRIMLRRLA
jgi:transposase